MTKLHLILDVEAQPNLWDPHEVIEDILAHAEGLPTFTPGMSWFIEDFGGSPAQAGTFVSCEWEANQHAAAIDVLTDLKDSLPTPHADKIGIIRAIEILRSGVR